VFLVQPAIRRSAATTSGRAGSFSPSQIACSLHERLTNSDGTPAEDLVLKFVGAVSRTALTGTFGMERVVLKRRTSYWQ
jgi:hypothetical protein